MDERPRVVVADAVIRALIASGVLPDGMRTRRVVIDLQAGRGHVPVMYVEYFGDQRLLDVVQALDGIEIRGVPADEPDMVTARSMDGTEREIPVRPDPSQTRMGD